MMSSGICNKNSEKSMKSPDETRFFEKGNYVEIAKVGETSIGRAYFEPGWSWEKCVKPIAKTESCQAPHIQYIISGRNLLKWMTALKRNLVLEMQVMLHQGIMHG